MPGPWVSGVVPCAHGDNVWQYGRTEPGGGPTGEEQPGQGQQGHALPSAQGGCAAPGTRRPWRCSGGPPSARAAPPAPPWRPAHSHPGHMLSTSDAVQRLCSLLCIASKLFPNKIRSALPAGFSQSTTAAADQPRTAFARPHAAVLMWTNLTRDCSKNASQASTGTNKESVHARYRPWAAHRVEQALQGAVQERGERVQLL